MNNDNMDELLLESREFSTGIPLVKLNVGSLTPSIEYYTIKTTANCEKHGEVLLSQCFFFNGREYCGKCYAEMIKQFCSEVE